MISESRSSCFHNAVRRFDLAEVGLNFDRGRAVVQSLDFRDQRLDKFVALGRGIRDDDLSPKA